MFSSLFLSISFHPVSIPLGFFVGTFTHSCLHWNQGQAMKAGQCSNRKQYHADERIHLLFFELLPQWQKSWCHSLTLSCIFIIPLSGKRRRGHISVSSITILAIQVFLIYSLFTVETRKPTKYIQTSSGRRIVKTEDETEMPFTWFFIRLSFTKEIREIKGYIDKRNYLIIDRFVSLFSCQSLSCPSEVSFPGKKDCKRDVIFVLLFLISTSLVSEDDYESKGVLFSAVCLSSFKNFTQIISWIPFMTVS